MKATETTILKFIGGEDKIFIIPPFQRNYAWTTEECEELFDDILTAVKNNKNHYLGNIIYYEGENDGASFSENILIDGQQRVTTILILLCAIRDVISDEETKRKINRKFLKNEDVDPDDLYRVRLKQTDYDDGCFKKLINGTLDSNEKGKIAENYRRFKDLLLGSEIDPKQIFEKIPKLEVVEVNLQTNELLTVQKIFEKINSTGKPLSAADLLRNYLLISDSVRKQRKLYTDYWVKIEEIITTEHISGYIKDYLIMKICEDVEESEVYNDFKNYVLNYALSQEVILNDLRNYAPYYKAIITNKTGNEKLDREIEILKYLASSDMYCLFMFLLKKQGEVDQTEIFKIFNLLRCFLTRFRIVGASGGGGALRSVVHSLLKKLQNSTIKCSFDDIQFELSNSSSKSGRYPDDEDFKEALMTSKKQNHSYGRAILLAIEEFETSNIPVNFDVVTIEHLMPQTLSESWIDALGGKEQAESTYNNYLHCIGNLAPLSGPYNSKNSNKIWTEKVKIMKDVQFKTTKEVLSLPAWNQDTIIERNALLAERACAAILAPVPRTRSYTSQNAFDDFVPGDYPISDLDTNMTGSDIKCVTIDGKNIQLTNWYNLLVKACEYVLDIDPQKFSSLVEDNLLHKDKVSKNPPYFDPIISKNKDLLNTGKKISSSEYYAEGNISSSRARFFTYQLLKYFDLVDSCTITVDRKAE